MRIKYSKERETPPQKKKIGEGYRLVGRSLRRKIYEKTEEKEGENESD
jgi:hypothetical protein